MKGEIMRVFSGVAEYYDEYMEGTGHVQAQRRVASFIAERNDGMVLDVATGTGIMLEPFGEGVGVDLSPAMAREARRKAPGREFIVADAHRLPFKDKAFEASMSCLAFLWFDDPELALREMLRVARRAYVVEEEGVPARKRIEIPRHLRGFFDAIGRLEREVSIEELNAYRSASIHRRVHEEDIDGSHKFVVYEVMS